VALWQLNAYNAITSEYELPEIDTDNREQTRITLAKSSLIQRATNSTFRDYND
jgi:hypothetical protein